MVDTLLERNRNRPRRIQIRINLTARVTAAYLGISPDSPPVVLFLSFQEAPRAVLACPCRRDIKDGNPTASCLIQDELRNLRIVKVAQRIIESFQPGAPFAAVLFHALQVLEDNGAPVLLGELHDACGEVVPESFNPWRKGTEFFFHLVLVQVHVVLRSYLPLKLEEGFAQPAFLAFPLADRIRH